MTAVLPEIDPFSPEFIPLYLATVLLLWLAGAWWAHRLGRSRRRHPGDSGDIPGGRRDGRMVVIRGRRALGGRGTDRGRRAASRWEMDADVQHA